MSPDYDLVIIGGGINGTGIARDAAGRGLRVLLVEKGDLASATSSASTKLIHGGLRYLEYYEFGLVRDSLKEREVLLGLAPHVIWPLQFVLPHDRRQRPAWMIRAGLFLYDHLARRKKLPGSGRINLMEHDFGKPLKGLYTTGFQYTDCWVDDSRLVVLNALDAAERGADILTRTECVDVRVDEGRWAVKLRDQNNKGIRYVNAKMVINVAGPWVRAFIERCGLDAPDVPHVRLVKGSHIIIKKAYQGDQVYILQQANKRIVFVIPYEQDFTLIGTTEEAFSGNPDDIRISEEETAYLCAAFNESFNTAITPGDVLWNYSGVRPLMDDGKDNATSVTRDYLLHRHAHNGPPALSVFGGKLTTYRVLAEKAVTMMLREQGRYIAPWTAGAPLPGGDINDGDFEGFVSRQAQIYPWLPPLLVRRYARAYGTRMNRFLDGARTVRDLGRDFGSHVYEAEIIYLIRHEWARTAEDILWRRSKLGLHVSDPTVQSLEDAVPALIKKVMS